MFNTERKTFAELSHDDKLALYRAMLEGKLVQVWDDWLEEWDNKSMMSFFDGNIYRVAPERVVELMKQREELAKQLNEADEESDKLYSRMRETELAAYESRDY